ncbi:hypothetical protein KA405_00470 [Patescibacteria group bacterium]|nr:hypothetical protein [Patescibacteria group bacterium]
MDSRSFGTSFGRLPVALVEHQAPYIFIVSTTRFVTLEQQMFFYIYFLRFPSISFDFYQWTH